LTHEKLSLLNRLEKEIKGSLITLLILVIIMKNEKIWGYQIKLTLKKLTGSNIQNSTLYTILRNLEKNYDLLTSEMIERRRYYTLSTKGIKETYKAINYWFTMMNSSLELFNELKVIIPKSITEVME
jgi:DNA-binding PadR family transcriptional regulator